MKKLRWYDFITVNLFWFGLNMRNNATSWVIMPYLVDIFVREDIKNTAFAGVRTAGLLIAMLVQPAAGLLSDRSTSRFGKRRPYILIGVLLDLLFLAAVALAWDYWSLLVAILLLQFSNNISHGALQGLIPDRVPEEQRGIASGVKAIFELLPLILTAFTIAKLAGAGQMTLAIIVTGVVLLVVMLLTLFLVKEEPLQEKPSTSIKDPMLRVLGMLAGIGLGAAAGLVGGALVGGVLGGITWLVTGFLENRNQVAMAVGVGIAGLVAMVLAVIVGVWAGALATLGKDARQHPNFTWWVVNRLLFLAAVTSIQGYAPYFLMYSFKISREAGVDLTGSLMTVVGIFTLLAALPGGWLSDRFGHKKLVGLSGIIAALGGFILLVTVWLPSLAIIYIAGCILGVAAGLFTATNWALGTELVPSAEAGRYLGISNLAGAGAGMIGTGIGGPVADYLNLFIPGLGYLAIFFYYAILFVLSTISLRWVKIK